jgi:hypothetical protein
MTQAKATQLDNVMRALIDRQPVNPVSAMHNGWGLRLAALIHRIKRRHGWPIETHIDDEGLAHYQLPDNFKPSRQQEP